MLRRHLLHLVLGVVVLDAVAIAAHRWAGVDGWPSGRRTAFIVVWTALTLLVVGVCLSRIRVARLEARRARTAR